MLNLVLLVRDRVYRMLNLVLLVGTGYIECLI